jgi:hypothetical protein
MTKTLTVQFANLFDQVSSNVGFYVGAEQLDQSNPVRSTAKDGDE